MALPATDDFNRASLGANWTGVDGTPTISSNEAAGGHINGNLAYWNADTFNDAQYAKVFNADGAAPNGGPATRVASLRCYCIIATLGDVKLYRIDGDESYSLLQTLNASGGVFDGSLLQLDSNGATHKAYQEGVQLGTDQNDATYTSGAAGWFVYGTGPRLDTWEGGNLGGGGGDANARLMGSDLMQSQLFGRLVC